MTLLRQIHKAQEREPPPAEAAHEYEPIPMSPTNATTGSTSPSTQLQPQTLQSNSSNKEDSDDDDNGRVYSSIPEELDQEDLYAEIDQTDPPTPSEGATTPGELDPVEEDNLDPNEIQLRLLLQIQKMVQRMEDVYGTAHDQTASPRAVKRETTKYKTLPRHVISQHSRNKADSEAPPPSSSPDPPSEAVIQKETNTEDIESKPIDQHPYYMNWEAINEAVTDSLPPPIPPKTYQVIDPKSSETVSKPAPPAPPASRSSDQRPRLNALRIPSHPSQLSAHPMKSPVQAQDIRIQVHQHQTKPRVGKKNYTVHMYSLAIYTMSFLHMTCSFSKAASYSFDEICSKPGTFNFST
jgi:hypothetical protein